VEVGTSRRGEVVGKDDRRVEFSTKKCVCMYAYAKMIPVETIPVIGDKGEWWRW
jgi:hypothetical protein